MLRHLPVIVVVAPLLSAPLCIIFRRCAFLRWFVFGVSIFILACAFVMLTQAANGFVWNYDFGAWPAPWGIAYQVDSLSALFVFLVALIASAVALFAGPSVAYELDGGEGYFFALFMLCCAGLIGVIVTNDMFNVFVFLEISSLSSYALVGLKRGGHAALAAYRYLLMGSVGAIFFLIGIGYLYMITGTLNFDDLALRLPEVTSNRAVLVALAFISAGLAMKIALFPLHWWLPDAYAFSLSPVSALLAGVSSKVAIYLVIRLFFDVFDSSFSFEESRFDVIVLFLSLAAIVIASAVAIFQDNVKHMMAYSSISQIGYITLGISLISPEGVGASLVYLFNHAVIKCSLFLALGCVVYRLGGCHIKHFVGLGKRMPWTMFAIVIGGLSLVGVPLTAGFIGKWQLISAIFEAGWWPLVIVVLGGSLLSVAYVWRLIEAAYLRPVPASESQDNHRCEAPFCLLGPVWLLIALNIYIGFHSEGLVTVATEIAHRLVGLE